MKKRKLGTSDLDISEVGLGCMSLGTEKNKALSILDEAIELGINYLDTADLYDRAAMKKLSVMRSKTDARILYWQQKRETVGMTEARAGIGTLQKLT